MLAAMDSNFDVAEWQSLPLTRRQITWIELNCFWIQIIVTFLFKSFNIKVETISGITNFPSKLLNTASALQAKFYK